mgnify:CR=1 FL=1
MCCRFALGSVSNKRSLLSDLIREITLIVKTPHKCGLSSSASAMEMPAAVSEPYLMLQVFFEEADMVNVPVPGFLWRGRRS